MAQTKHALPDPTRRDVIALRTTRMADRLALVHQAKAVPGNVQGPPCLAWHTLVDALVEAAEASRALLAAWVVHLRGTAEGALQVATPRTGLAADSRAWRAERTMALRPREPQTAKACRSPARVRRRAVREKAQRRAGRPRVTPPGAPDALSCRQVEAGVLAQGAGADGEARRQAGMRGDHHVPAKRGSLGASCVHTA
jgi:DNA-binding ferritin-like protein